MTHKSQQILNEAKDYIENILCEDGLTPKDVSEICQELITFIQTEKQGMDELIEDGGNK